MSHSKKILLHCIFAHLLLLLTGCPARPTAVGEDKDVEIQRERKSDVVFIVSDSVDWAAHSRNFYYHDSLARGHMFLMNQKETKLTINNSVFLVIADKNQTPFLIHPGDSIQVDYFLSDTVRMRRLGESGVKGELNFFRELIKVYGALHPMMMNRPPLYRKVNEINQLDLMHETIGALALNRLAFLEQYNRAHLLDTEFYQMAQDYIRLAAVNDSIYSYTINRSLVEKQGLLRPFLERTQKTTLDHYSFQAYWPWYAAYIHIVELAVDFRGRLTEDMYRKKIAYINEEFEGEIKDFLLSHTFNVYLDRITIPEADWQKLDHWLENDGYRQIMNRKKAHSDDINRFSGTDMLVSVDAKDTMSSAILLDQLQGNVVLLDFWASWCVPCRKEFPASKALLAELQGEPFKTVYLSLDDDFGAWQKAVQDEGLGDANNYYILGRKESSLVNTFSVGPIPRYILLDKEGEVISRDAPRPSDTELKKIIEAHL